MERRLLDLWNKSGLGVIKKKERQTSVSITREQGQKTNWRGNKVFLNLYVLEKDWGPMQRKKLRQKKREGQRRNQTGRNHL